MKHTRASRRSTFAPYEASVDDDGMGELERLVLSEIDSLFQDRPARVDARESRETRETRETHESESDVAPESPPIPSAEQFADELLAMIGARDDNLAVVAALRERLEIGGPQYTAAQVHEHANEREADA